MRLLRLISWPYVRRHMLRWVLTTAGIVLGVGVFVAMHTANRAVLFGFHQTVDRIAGATQLQVSAGDPGFDEEVLERVQAHASVRVAVPVIEASVETGLPGQGNLLILGIDMTGDRSLRDYDLESGEESVVDDPLVFLAQPDSLIVTREFASRNTLETGSRVPLRTMEGEKAFTVRGIMKSGGLTSAFGGNLAVMDVYAAQAVFGRGRKFDRIDLGVRDGVDVATVQKELQQALGPAFHVEAPSARGVQFEAMLRAYSISADVSSLLALFIGLFIIYNSFAIAVTQRRYEIGVLRALGATRRQVRWMFLVESALAGLAGSIAGIGLGLVMARGMAVYIGGLMHNVYGVSQQVEDISSDPLLLAGALATGIATSMLAAWIPARNAARVDPVYALQKGKYQVLTRGENRVRRSLAAVTAAGCIVCLLFSHHPTVFYAGYVLAIVTALLLTPTLTVWLARALRPLLRRLRPVEGALAVDSLLQAPRRTSGTVTALMLSLAIAIGFGGISHASYNSIMDWVDGTLNPDFFIAGSQTLAVRTFAFPAEVGEGLKQVEGIREIQMVRAPRIQFRGVPVSLVSVELATVGRLSRRRVIAGDTHTMYEEAGAGRGLIVSDNLALLRDLHLGEIIEIPAPRGTVRLPIVGIITDYSDQQGSILIDRSVFMHYWNDDSANIFRVYLQSGASPDEVKRRILDRFAGQRRLFVLSNAEVRQYIERTTEQWVGLTYIQIAVAVLVAVLGIVNTLTVSIIDRRRELGVLQAVGAFRKQVRRTVRMEALAIGILGIVLGMALGAVNLYYTLEYVRRDLAGLRLDYVFPLNLSAMLFPIILGAAALAAVWPSESAVRGSLVEALEYE